MKNNYYKATLTVGIATLGFCLAYPFHSTFWGGLLAEGCSAAMIGGLADWFAVTALFRRPLGIKPGRVIRTEIIPRNRERIFAALADMVQNELLTPRALKQRLEVYNISQMLLRYFEQDGGKEDFKDILNHLVQDTLAKFDPELAGQLASQLLEQSADSLELSPIISELIENSLAKGYDEQIVDFILLQALSLVQHPHSGSIIYQIIKEAMETYEKGRDRRRLVNGLLLQLSPLGLAELVQSKLAETLREVYKFKNHPWREKLREQIQIQLDRLRTSPDVQQKVEGWKNALIEQLRPEAKLRDEILSRKDMFLNNLGNKLHEKLVEQFEKFQKDRKEQDRLDSFIKDALIKWIDLGHDQIGQLVKDNLSKLTKAKFVELIEDKAGNDLQMIRINGTVVGGLVGILIYLVTYWLG